MPEELRVALIFYGMGAFGCGLVLMRRLRNKWSAGVVLGCLVLLLFWPVMAGDVIDMDHEDHGY